MFNEYLTAKHKSDPEWLRTALLKAKLEPYIHLTIEQVNTIFGREQAQKKALFEDWWNSLSPDEKKGDPETLSKKFDAWFQAKIPTTPSSEPNPIVD